MPVTIRDVAKAAGVSPSTVSRTIRNNPAISKATKLKVRAAMEEVGYVPPFSDESESHEPPMEVGIILPPSQTDTYNNPFFLEVIRGISEYCNQNGAMTALITGKDDQEVIDSILSSQSPDVVSSYILLFSRAGDPIIRFLYSQGLDYVLIGSASEYSNETVSVDNDNIEAGRCAAQYLYERGHRRFCFIGAPFSNLFSAARRNGFLLFLNEKNIPQGQIDLIETEHGNESGQEKIRRVLQRDDATRPTAFVTSDDMHALTLRQLAADAGLDIPNDVSIVSFNNSIFARLTSPALTSIEVHPFQLGREAAAQAISRAKTPSPMASKTLVPFALIQRDSTCYRTPEGSERKD